MVRSRLNPPPPSLGYSLLSAEAPRTYGLTPPNPRSGSREANLGERCWASLSKGLCRFSLSQHSEVRFRDPISGSRSRSKNMFAPAPC